jgi:hypothetical protein
MILYNLTVNIDKEAEKEWLQWMKQTHIPDVLNTGMFIENKFYRILHDAEDGSINYSVQYFAESIDNVLEYQKKYAPKLQQDSIDRFGEKFVVFRTLLETVE